MSMRQGTGIRKIAALAAGLLLALCLAGCVTGTGKPEPEPVPDETDQMWRDREEDAQLRVFLLNGRMYTADHIYEVGAFPGEPAEDGRFYRITADVDFLNGGVAGYVDYPEIRRVSKTEEISPFTLDLPEITGHPYGLSRIGEYADGDFLLNEFGKMAVWKDGAWIYRYDRTGKTGDGRMFCCRSSVSEEDILAGIREGVLSCADYFVLPPFED